MRKFTIQYSKKLAKYLQLVRIILESKRTQKTCIKCKLKLEKIYHINVDGISTRSNCDWYKPGER